MEGVRFTGHGERLSGWVDSYCGRGETYWTGRGLLRWGEAYWTGRGLLRWGEAYWTGSGLLLRG